ncbi:MAG TPA: dihydrofolate reductase family protein, partial [Cytophagaceae bacterium]|nr:dihydrofolate reductase family protein [Cytophagaceae bacterium]
FKKQEVRNMVEYVKLDPVEDLMKHIIQDLYERKIQSILVEGGTILLTSFIKKSLWDEAKIFRSNQVFGSGIEAPLIRGRSMNTDKIGIDELMVYRK